MQTKLKVIFYSMYDPLFRLTEAIAQGANEVKDVQVEVFRIPEFTSEEILEKSGAKAAQQAYSHIPVIQLDQLADTDAYIFGSSTRFGNICSQMRHFLDQCGSWMKNNFTHKIASVYTSAGLPLGGQEIMTSFHTTLFQLGMMVVNTPKIESAINNSHGHADLFYGTFNEEKRMPSENELATARYQGKYVAEIAKAFKLGRNMI